MLHEAGHFLTAKHYGMKASRFFVGFGPTLWSFRRGETEYGVKAIPAGGFVKIVGMTELEEVAPEDEERAFYRQPAGRRAVVLAAGSVTHFLLALVVIYIGLVSVGLPTDRPIVGRVQTCVVQTAADRACAPGDPAAPAARAGLKSGDRITAIGATSVSTYE